ncbi:MAG: glycosyltransferase family 2 protein [Verrucomicrobia bacterium]|nr:glycosyltransferase family 2 protein [Verrucomicrobiota bacterium]
MEDKFSARVALLLPAYNSAAYLPEMVAQARQQTVPFAEIICYDDASRDDTAAVADGLGIRVIRGAENRGAAFARNRLLEATRCDWVHFHDVDDELSPRFLEKMVQLLCDPRTAAVCATRKTWDDNSRPTRIERFPRLESEPDLLAFFLTHFIHLNAFIFPRAFLLQIGAFRDELRLAEDTEFEARAAARGLKCRYLDEALVGWRIHPQSTTGRVSRQLRWQYDQLYIKRLLECLNARYRRILGESWLYRAWWLYYTGQDMSDRRYIDIARLCGVRHLAGASMLERLLSHGGGPRTAFFLKKFWSRLRHGRAGVH